MEKLADLLRNLRKNLEGIDILIIIEIFACFDCEFSFSTQRYRHLCFGGKPRFTCPIASPIVHIIHSENFNSAALNIQISRRM